MLLEDTDMDVSLDRARLECRNHGAVLVLVDNGHAAEIRDGHSVYSGEVWGKVRVRHGHVNGRAVLNVLGY
jgi:hypothetical protein